MSSLFERIKIKIMELDDLEKALNRIKEHIQKEKPEEIPPLWSGDVKDLPQFVKELGEWLEQPKIKMARSLIKELKKYAQDERDFSALPNDYLINILSDLKNAVQFIVGDIKIKELKSRASKAILDTLLEQEKLTELINKIKKYWRLVKEFLEIKVTDDFSNIVKKDLENNLIKGDFTPDNIERAKTYLDKAQRAINLLSETKVSIRAYVDEYKAGKNIDEIWNLADEIRKLLSRTNYSYSKRREYPEPLRKLIEIFEKREQCLQETTLSRIKECLSRIENRIAEWRKSVMENLLDEYKKVLNIAGLINMSGSIEELYTLLRNKVEKSMNLDEINEAYLKFIEQKRQILKELEKRGFSDEEKKILENIDRADELVEEMGDSFWKGLRALREKDVIKIVVERV